MAYKQPTKTHRNKTLAAKAKTALDEFEQAVRDHAWRGANDPGSWKEIDDRLKAKRNKLMRMLPWVDKPQSESSSD